MERVDTDSYSSLKSYMKEQINSFLTVTFVADLKLIICCWMILNGVMHFYDLNALFDQVCIVISFHLF